MNEQELQAIEERANKASNAPWLIEAGDYSGHNWLVGTITVSLGESYRDDKAYFVTTRNVHASELEGDASTDAEFIAHARSDVPALIAEVRRLRAKLDAVPEYLFWCLLERDRGESVFPSLGEWIGEQQEPQP